MTTRAGRRSRLGDAAEIAGLRAAVAPVRQREVVRRAHFVQARGGAGELERLRAVGAGIKPEKLILVSNVAVGCLLITMSRTDPSVRADPYAAIRLLVVVTERISSPGLANFEISFSM